MITTTTTQSKARCKKISYDEFERIKNKFPKCDVAKFQASCEEVFFVEWTHGNNYPSRLVHEFRPIFG
jgi:hypothetical protein